MGWANCGRDSQGRQIGYAFPAVCDEPGCGAKIDRGLAYACGGMHGEGAWYCEGYYCPEHLTFADVTDEDREAGDPLVNQLCARCARRYDLCHRPRDARGRFMTVRVSP